MSYNSSEKGNPLVGAAVLLALPLLIFGRCSVSNSTITNVTMRIDKQQAVPEKGYLFWATPVAATEENGKTIYTPVGEQEVLTSQKAVFQGKWSSSNIVGQIQDGGVYRLKVNWFRSPVTDSYRNILEVQRLDKPDQPAKSTSIKINADMMQFAVQRMRQTGRTAV